MDSLFQWLASKVAPYVDTTVHNRLTRMEAHMAKTDQALADLDAATDEIAAELENLRDDVAQYDADLAAKLGAKVERLKGLAKDPANPVPDAGTEPVVENPGAGEVPPSETAPPAVEA